MQSIEDKILSIIKKCGRGTICFAHDMLRYGQRQSVLKALERMAASGTILRVARGIYCYPKIDKVLGLGMRYPIYGVVVPGLRILDVGKLDSFSAAEAMFR